LQLSVVATMQFSLTTALLVSFVVGSSALACGPGSKFKAALATSYCKYGPASPAADCGVSPTECCIVDPLTCGGLRTGITCATGKYVAKTDDAKKTAEATKVVDCCSDVKTCADTSYACAAGYKKKAAATPVTKCTGAAATCVTPCCEKDVAKCGGLSGIVCAAGFYNEFTSLFTLQATKDVWVNKAATDDTKNTACCTAVATCASTTYNCPAGYKKKAAATPATKCTGPAATCATGATCCEADTAKCGGLSSITCAAGKFKGADDAWKNKAATDETKATACCAAQADCTQSGYACPAGWKKIASKTSADKCTGAALTCASGSTCCEKDPKKCGGLTGIACPATHFDESTKFTERKISAADQNTWKNKAATDATKNSACCTKRTTCDLYKAATTTSSALVSGSAHWQPGSFIPVALFALASLWVM